MSLRHLLPTALLLVGVLVVTSCVPATYEPEPCPASQCSSHGTCVTDNLTPVCSCDEGYTGTSCERCADDFRRVGDACVYSRCFDDACGDGTCDDSTGVPVCTCPLGYVGAGCVACAPGFHSDGLISCIRDVECHDNTCSGRGACVSDGVAVTCTCDDGFAGDHCDELVHTACDDDLCGPAGTCVDDDGPARCMCNVGVTGATCDSCAVGFHDDNGTCVVDEICEQGSCSGVGDCAVDDGAASCSCFTGYEGVECEACAAGFHRNDVYACVADVACPVDDPCAPGGVCDDATGEAICICNAGHVGAHCEQCRAQHHDDGTGVCVPDASCAAHTCNGGLCDDAGGVIVCSACPAGFEGERCDANIDDCNHDACVGTAATPGTCLDLIDDYACLCPGDPDAGTPGSTAATCP